jgi:serine/threonine-protein kinase
LAGGLLSEPSRRRIESLRADVAMLERLEQARLDQAAVKDSHFDTAAADAAYDTAFREYGLGVEGVTPQAVAGQIRARSIQPQLVAALDDWAYVRRELKREGWGRLGAIARAADPDPWRNRLRDALEGKDSRALEELAASAPVGEWPAITLVLLDRLSRGTPVGERVVALLRQAQQRYPADFWINHELAAHLAELRPPRTEEAIGYYRAAVALRPHSPGARLNLGEALRGKGALDEAIAEYREAIHHKKDYAAPHSCLGIALAEKGRLDEAIDEFREALRLKKDFSEAHKTWAMPWRRRAVWTKPFPRSGKLSASRTMTPMPTTTWAMPCN